MALLLAPLPACAADDLRIVLQADPNAHQFTENSAISADSRYVVAVGATNGTVVIWDVASGNIIDRVQLPLSPADNALIGQPRMSADDARITIDTFVRHASPFACRQQRYSYALATRTLRSDLAASTPPGKAQGLTAAEQAICDGTEPAAPASTGGLQVELISSGNSYTAAMTTNLALAVVDARGNSISSLSRKIPDQLGAVALSPDTRYLAYVNAGDVISAQQGMSFNTTPIATTITIFDLATGSFLDPVVVKGDSDIFQPRLAWRTATQLLLSWDHPPHLVSNFAAPPDAHIIDIGASPARDTPVPGRCLVVPLADGELVGSGAASCLDKPKPQAALSSWSATTGWKPFDLPTLAGQTIHALVASADGHRLAVVTEGAGIDIVDLAARRIVAHTALTSENVFDTPLVFLPDGRLVFATNDEPAGTSRNWIWQPGLGEPQALSAGGAPEAEAQAQAQAMFSDGSTLVTAHGHVLSRTSLPGGAMPPQPPPGLDIDEVVAGGFAEGGRLFWAASPSDGLRFWNTADWSPAMNLYLLDQQHFFALAPSGHYDTNLGPDTNAFRWLVHDAPLQSLGPQTFMRDYFLPRLTATVLDGSETKEPVPPILTLDRVLPQVRIARVSAGPTPDIARVDLEVREGVDPRAANGKKRSGRYDLRLFRDDALIAEWPPAKLAADPGLPQWRHDNALAPGPDGVVRIQALVTLPTGADARNATLSAYAFNADRIKSDTASFAYTRPAMPPRPRHAYVLTIGINSYHEPRLQLQFAANDAQLLAQRLTRLPGYDVRQIVLAGTVPDPTDDQPAQPMTKAVIAAAIDLLGSGDRAQALAVLKSAGIDGSPFAKATPDDLVIVTFSGHGWADPHGNFYLLPADAAWPDSAPIPQQATLISSGEITARLRGIDAGAMALVIDACHSAASVATSSFKPGPMGDPGLGQLAYDKGIRILAATQSDDVAMEDAALKQGLLTYTLASEGIAGDGSGQGGSGLGGGFGKADLNGDGRIMLDEWLRYALRRLPTLSNDERLRHFGGGFAGTRHVTIISDTQALPPKPQDPALFDFNAAPSTVALREKTP